MFSSWWTVGVRSVQFSEEHIVGPYLKLESERLPSLFGNQLYIHAENSIKLPNQVGSPVKEKVSWAMYELDAFAMFPQQDFWLHQVHESERERYYSNFHQGGNFRRIYTIKCNLR